ncbi:hypothetical protein WG66_002521 [Moniliophthora roreri]|nr:hypothetical protein WG66_002521 [Moniliophthora roreri]
MISEKKHQVLSSEPLCRCLPVTWGCRWLFHGSTTLAEIHVLLRLGIVLHLRVRVSLGHWEARTSIPHKFHRLPSEAGFVRGEVRDILFLASNTAIEGGL